MRSIDPRTAKFLALVLPLAASLVAGCGTSGQTTQADLDDTISVATSVLQIATSAAQIANAANGAGSIPAPAPIRQPAAATAAANPSTNGYSQRGAFEDCAKMYSAAGMEALAADCKARAERMGSLR